MGVAKDEAAAMPAVDPASARAEESPAAPGPIEADAWQALRRFTAARIALGHAGVSLPTARHLEFQLAHARARDAVHVPLEAERLRADLRGLQLDVMELHSAAADRHMYLQRPDLGRRLDEASRTTLARAQSNQAGICCDVAFVMADGLSALAIERHAVPVLGKVLPKLAERGCKVAPLVVVRQGRVAIGDEIGALLGVRLVVVLVGERPGLSSPDSLGIYLTWAPHVGRVDSERNCISNIRPEGLDYEAAASRMVWLLDQATTRKLTGVALKDEMEMVDAPLSPTATFLLSE